MKSKYEESYKILAVIDGNKLLLNTEDIILGNEYSDKFNTYIFTEKVPHTLTRDKTISELNSYELYLTIKTGNHVTITLTGWLYTFDTTKLNRELYVLPNYPTFIEPLSLFGKGIKAGDIIEYSIIHNNRYTGENKEWIVKDKDLWYFHNLQEGEFIHHQFRYERINTN